MASLRFCLLEDRAVLAVSGEDRVSFLQGLVSNDMAKVSDKRAVWAALLTPQGRYLFDMVAVGMGDAILLDVERGRLADLKKKLSVYRLRSRVALDELGGLEVAALWGDGAAAAMRVRDEAGAADGCGHGFALVDPRLAALGVRAYAPKGMASTMMNALGAEWLEPEAYDLHRLALGVPDGSRDLPVEKALLLESGFDELNGVDWKKGCYMGQELTARTKYRGLVKKRLLPVAVEGPMPPSGAPVLLDGQEAGEMRSGRDGRALALLRLDALEAAKGGATLRSGEAVLTPSLPAWLRLPGADAAA